MADLPVDKPRFSEALRSLSERGKSQIPGAPRSRVHVPLVAVVVVVVVLAVLLVVGTRKAPARIAPAAVDVVQSPASQLGRGVFVHVAGAVRKPGLYELGPDDRVADAISAAGGTLRKADVDALNLAQVIADGMKIDVPMTGEAPVSTPADAPSGSALISINSAPLDELETLPGVGPVTAEAIIDHREQTGGFDSLEQLLDVSGIGPATFAEIRPHVTL